MLGGMARPINPQTLTLDPAVILDIVLESGVLSLRLTNISAKPVTGIRVTFSRKIIGIGGRVDIGKLPVFTRLEFLAPARVIDVPVDRAEVFFARNSAEPLVASVAYVDTLGHKQQAEMRHDLTVWRDLPEIG